MYVLSSCERLLPTQKSGFGFAFQSLPLLKPGKRETEGPRERERERDSQARGKTQFRAEEGETMAGII